MDKSQIQKRTKEITKKTDNPKQFIKALQILFKSLVDKEATKNYQRIIPETGKFYGVPKPILWMIASEIGKFLTNNPAKAERLLKVIWTERSYEARQIAGKSIEKFGSKNPELCLDFISSALPDIDNWSVCDSLAMYGLEPIVYSNPQLILPLSGKWIKDKNKWIRRFGVVSLRGYKRLKTTNKVFSVLDSVMKEDKSDVKKAISWILREITKKNPKEIVKFLIKWAKSSPNKDTSWMIKDGMKKLPSDKQREISRLLKC